MKLPIVVMRRRTLDGEHDAWANERMRVIRENVQLGNELSAVRSSVHGETQAHAHEVLRLKDHLSQASALAADKQREIAMLRAQLAEKELHLQAESTAAREERQKLMDWIAKGVSNGIPIFAEIPLPVAASSEVAPAVPLATERVPNDVEEAIAAVGRRPRAIVNHISKKRDVDFAAAMAGAGVKRIFDEDRVTAEVEATVISEQAQTA